MSGKGMWDIDENGNIVWREGATRSDLTGGERVGPWGINIFPEGSPIGQEILRGRAVGMAPPPVPDWQMEELEQGREYLEAERLARGVPLTGGRNSGRDFYRGGGIPAGERAAGARAILEAEAAAAADDELNAALAAFLAEDGLGGGTGGGYTPSFVDISSAEAMLPLTQTPEEEAALEQMLRDIQQRGQQGIAAVRSGWEGVRAVNQAAADKARQMAIEAGPEAARLWVDAANNALTFARQTADAFTNIAGMQSVNISPTGGAQNIAALLAAQAPRARAFAERMGLASAQDIASQARTASMMGEAYAGEIIRTVLQQAQEARAAHNQRVFDRIAQNRQIIAQMRASAAATNAEIANRAAEFAAEGARNPQERAERIRALYEDIDMFAVSDEGPRLLARAYNLPPDVAERLIEAQRSGTLARAREEGLVEAEIATALKE